MAAKVKLRRAQSVTTAQQDRCRRLDNMTRALGSKSTQELNFHRQKAAYFSGLIDEFEEVTPTYPSPACRIQLLWGIARVFAEMLGCALGCLLLPYLHLREDCRRRFNLRFSITFSVA